MHHEIGVAFPGDDMLGVLMRLYAYVPTLLLSVHLFFSLSFSHTRSSRPVLTLVLDLWGADGSHETRTCTFVG